MKYLLIRMGRVDEIIPEEDPIFPGVPITDRYAPDFLAKCDKVPDDTVVEIGWVKTEAGYEVPPEPEVSVEPGFPVDPPAPQPTYTERIVALEEQNAALKAQNQMLEDCLVDMAGIVYA